jgi:hypothetical protein
MRKTSCGIVAAAGKEARLAEVATPVQRGRRAQAGWLRKRSISAIRRGMTWA